ncbi:hypothetical protein NQF86_09090, partial [Bombella sp. TMW 2.2543]
GSYASSGTSVLSGREHLNVQAWGDVRNAGLMGGGAGTYIQAASLENEAQAILVGLGAPLEIRLTGQDGLQNAGTIQTQHLPGQGSGADLNIVAPALVNSGTVTSADDLTVTAGRVVNQGGTLQAVKGMTFNSVGEFYNNKGTVLNSQGDLILNANIVRNESGNIESAGDLRGALGQYSSDAASRLVAQKVMSLSASGGLENNGLLGGGTELTVEAASIQNGVQGHILSNQGDVALTAPQGSIRNQGVIEERNPAAQLALSAASLNNGGTLLSAGTIALKNVQDVVNSSAIYGAGGLVGQITGQLDNSNGLFVIGGGDAHLSAARVVNGSGTIQATGGRLTLQAGQVDNRGGQIAAAADVQLLSDLLSNQDGVIQAGGDLSLGRHGAQVDNDQGVLQASQNLNVTAARLTNSNGKILSLGGDLTVNNATDNFSPRLADEQVTDLDNGSGSLQAAGSVALGLLNWKDDARSIITASQHIALSSESPLTVNGLLMGGQGINLQSSGLTVAPGGQIISGNGLLALELGGNGLDSHGTIEAQGQDAHLTVQSEGNIVNHGTLLSTGSMGLTGQRQLVNGGTVGALDGDLTIQAQSLMNQGKIASSGWLNSAFAGDVHNAGQMYGQRGQFLSGAGIDNQRGEISSRGDLTIQGQSLANNAGRILSDAGTVTAQLADAVSNHGGLIQGLGNISVTAASFDNSQQGTVLSRQGVAQLSTARPFNNQGGTVQGEQGVQLTASSLDNSRGGLINAVSGGVNITAPGGNGLDVFHNEGGTIQANGDLHLAVQHLSNADGKILQQSETGVLSLDGGAGKLVEVVAGSVGTIQTKGSLSLAVNSLHGVGALIAPQDLSVTTYTPDADAFFQAGRDAFITILGDYHTAIGAGVLAGRNATVQAASISNDGALMANGGTLTVHSDRDIYNTGLLYGATGLAMTLPGTLTNHKGAILTGNGSILVQNNNQGNISAFLNQSGLVRADGEQSDIFIKSHDIENVILGNIRVVTPSKPNHVVFDHMQGGERYGTIDVPKGLLDEHGEQGKGYLEFWASHKGQKANRGSYQVQMTESYIEIDGSDKSYAPPLISAGHDILLSSEGNIINKAGHVAAGNNLTLQGTSLDNYGYNITKQYSIYYWDRRGARVSSANSTVPIKSYFNGDETIPWGNIIIIPGSYSGYIKAGNNINGDIKGDIKNVVYYGGAGGKGLPDFGGSIPAGLSGRSSTNVKGADGVSGSAGSGGASGLNPAGRPLVEPTPVAWNDNVSLPGFSGTTVAVSSSSIPTAEWKPADQSSPNSTLTSGVSVPTGKEGSLSAASVHQVEGGALTG